MQRQKVFGHYKCESIYLMKNKIKDLNDVEQITEEYMDYYINYRPQNLGHAPKTI